MKYLICGLGNIGDEYADTRHNIGFWVLDALAKALDAKFEISRHAYRAEAKFKGRTLILLKPTTYMNLSGKAVKYWLDKENIPKDNLLIIVDDLALEPGIRLPMPYLEGRLVTCKNMPLSLINIPFFYISAQKDFGCKVIPFPLNSGFKL